MNIVIAILIVTNIITLLLCCKLTDLLHKLDAELEKDLDWIDPESIREVDE